MAESNPDEPRRPPGRAASPAWPWHVAPPEASVGPRAARPARSGGPDRNLRRPAVVLHAVTFALMLGATACSLAATDSSETAPSASSAQPVPGVPTVTAGRHEILYAWGAGGHYWAVYFIALLAGYEKDEAWRIAFFAWMPDQVEELDAAALFWAELGHTFAQSQTAHYLPPPPVTAADWLGLPLPTLNRLTPTGYRNLIHRGLHCLTGANADAETAYRVRCAEAAAAKRGRASLAFGVSIHPFGDSFSHRNTDESEFSRQRTYRTGIGHGAEIFSGDVPRLNPEWFKKHGGGDWHFDDGELKGHAPDHLDFRPDVTTAYLVAMYRLFRKTSGAGEPRLPHRLFREWPKTSGTGDAEICVSPDAVGRDLAAQYASVLQKAMNDEEVGMATFEFALKLWGAGAMRPNFTSSVFPDNPGYYPHGGAVRWNKFVDTNPGARELRLRPGDLEDLLVVIQDWAAGVPKT